MTDQELFEKLKREQECWHEFINTKDTGYPEWSECFADSAVLHVCKKCSYEYYDLEEEGKNVDFTTPDGFFWLWDRVWEKRMFKAFLGECEISELDPHMSPEMAVPILFKHIVHPTRFTESLKEYLKGKRR